MSKCCDVGFVPVQAKENETVFVDLMLRPRDAEFNFAFATWDNIRARTALHEFLTGEDDDAEKKFNDLKETTEAPRRPAEHHNGDLKSAARGRRRAPWRFSSRSS